MTAIRLSLGLSRRTAMTRAWHLWTVIIPRRTITGRLVRGKVWRRHDGRHWLYKKFIAQDRCREHWRGCGLARSVDRSEDQEGGRGGAEAQLSSFCGVNFISSFLPQCTPLLPP